MAQLTSLDLGFNDIGAEGAAWLAPSLVLMAQLTSLNLNGNWLGAVGVAALAPSLALMARLTSLDLGDNAIGDAGAASLAPSLALMPQLTSLDLELNDFGTAGAASLAPSLARMRMSQLECHLVSLDLRRNLIGAAAERWRVYEQLHSLTESRAALMVELDELIAVNTRSSQRSARSADDVEKAAKGRKIRGQIYVNGTNRSMGYFARDKLAADQGVNPAEVEGRDWLLAKILAEQTTP